MLFRSNDTATTEIYTVPYTLPLHDALPIYPLADAAQAHRDLESRKTTGKLLLVPTQ